VTVAPVLVVVTDFEHAPEELLLARIERVCVAARAGSVLVQLRDHGLSALERFSLGLQIIAITRQSSQLFAVNDRIDLALALGADSVHLGEGSVRPSEARLIIESAWISVASHDPALVDIDVYGADAVLLAPIFEARHGRDALGVAAIARARTGAGRARLYALGGIDAGNARSALQAGAEGVAVMGAVRDSDEPAALLGALGITR
jgi:thiamine-phosphate pyrophosphorylase